MRAILLLLAFLIGGWFTFNGVAFALEGETSGFVSAALGLALIIGAIVAIRRKGGQLREDLQAGRDVIARWQVSPSDLGAFHDLDRRRTDQDSDFANQLSLPDTAPPEGLSIIIGRQDWMIGDRLYRGSPPIGMLFANVATLDGDPGYIEVATLLPRQGTGYFLMLGRVPVPAGARSAARTAADHLAGRVPPSNHDLLARYFPDYVDGLTG